MIKYIKSGVFIENINDECSCGYAGDVAGPSVARRTFLVESEGGGIDFAGRYGNMGMSPTSARGPVRQYGFAPKEHSWKARMLILTPLVLPVHAVAGRACSICLALYKWGEWWADEASGPAGYSLMDPITLYRLPSHVTEQM